MVVWPLNTLSPCLLPVTITTVTRGLRLTRKQICVVMSCLQNQHKRPFSGWRRSDLLFSINVAVILPYYLTRLTEDSIIIATNDPSGYNYAAVILEQNILIVIVCTAGFKCSVRVGKHCVFPLHWFICGGPAQYQHWPPHIDFLFSFLFNMGKIQQRELMGKQGEQIKVGRVINPGGNRFGPKHRCRH